MEELGETSVAHPAGRSVAWTLIAAAVITPPIVAYFTGATSYQVGSRGAIGWIFIALAAFTAHRVTRYESAHQKTIALWAAVLIAVGIAGFASYRAVRAAAIDAEVVAAGVDMKATTEASIRIAHWLADHPDEALENSPAFGTVRPAGIDLKDHRLPLHDRMLEFSRRARLRDLETTAALNSAIYRSNVRRPAAFVISVADVARRPAALSALESARTLVADTLPSVERSVAAGLADIDALGLPDEQRLDMRGGFERSANTTLPALKVQMDEVAKTLNDLDAVAKFIEAAPDARLRDGKLVFVRPQTQAEFERRFGNLFRESN
jgi:hypothetical protein